MSRSIAAPSETRFRRWRAVSTIALGTFVMVTSEFLPVGLLGSIARDLGAPEGRTGLLLSAPGLVAAISAPAFAVLAGRLDRRLVLAGLMLSIALSDLAVAHASHLWTALAGRMLLGLALGGVWTFAAAIGRRLVAEEEGNRAAAIVMGGISLGTVLGVPIGTLAGGMAGWRAAFGGVALLALIALAVQLAVIPQLEARERLDVKAMAAVLRVPAIRVGFLATALVVAGHFSAYAYLEPALAARGLSGPFMAWLLAGYGLAGLVGVWLGTGASEAAPRRALAGAMLAIGLTIGIAALAGGIATLADSRLFVTTAMLLVWGAAFGALPLCLQVWILRAAPQRFEASSAQTNTVFQFSVALGALAGGMFVDHGGVGRAWVIGSGLALAGALVFSVKSKRG
jgi:predicted MFS family arabinose efflux permease